MPDRKDPYTSFRFSIEINGIISGGFAECSGLQVETEIEDYREGGLNEYAHKLSKGTKYQNITLKRGITDYEDMWYWHQAIVFGLTPIPLIGRRNVFIILKDSEGNEKWRWHIQNAFPVKWTGPELRSDSNTVAFETLELAHTGITKF